MKKTFLLLILIALSLNIFSQERINVIPIIEKSETVYEFTLTGKNLDLEFDKINKKFGEPTSCEVGEIVWDNIKIDNVGENMQIKLTDGLLTTKKDKTEFKAFKKTMNKNKSKSCQLKCLEENQSRQFIFTITKNDKNIINAEEQNKAVQKFLESII